MYTPMQQGEDHDYFAARKMGRQLLKSPYDTTWWNSSKYLLSLHRFDPLPRDAQAVPATLGTSTSGPVAARFHATRVVLDAVGLKHERLVPSRATEELEHDPSSAITVVAEVLDLGTRLLLGDTASGVVLLPSGDCATT